MVTLTPTIIMMLAASVVCQVIGLSLMPLTKGVTQVSAIGRLRPGLSGGARAHGALAEQRH